MKYPAYENNLVIGAVLGCLAGAAIAIGIIAASSSLKRHRINRLRREAFDEDEDGPSLIEDLVAHNLNGF
jgi:hypothetical protein